MNRYSFTRKRTMQTYAQSFFFYPGSFLLSRAVTSQVSSALQSLTSVFGMGTGVSSASSPPSYLIQYQFYSTSAYA